MFRLREQDRRELVRFFVGLHKPHHAANFDRAFISVNRLRERKSLFPAKEWIMDSGAFSTILKHGGYPFPPDEYAREIVRWKSNGKLLAAVTQDYMCERDMLAITGLTVADHQRLTIERYDALITAATGVYIMPVLQGYTPCEYVDHIGQYGDRLTPGMWVGVGSVCKRNGSPKRVLDVLIAIKTERPDLRLHGFGLKITALSKGTIRALLESADSMAWSFAARKKKQNANDWRNAEKFRARIDQPLGEYQGHFIEL
jgi:hypothetical protein